MEEVVLIAGATGFIGGHILRYLTKKEGVTIYAVSRRNVKITSNRVKLLKISLLDSEKLNNKLKDIDVQVVINFTGKLGGPLVSREELLRSNYTIVKNLVDIHSKYQNIDQFIHMSSFGVLGPLPNNKIPADENCQYNPSNAYEKSKSIGETYIKNSDLPYTILRPEFVYGLKDMHLLPLFKKIIERKIVLINGGKTYLHPTFIGDVVSIVDKVFLNKKAVKEVFNIGGERYITVKEFVETVYYIATGENYKFRSVPAFCLYPFVILGETLKLFRTEFPLNIERLKFFTENRAVDYRKAEKILEYRPISLVKGLKITIGWYYESGFL